VCVALNIGSSLIEVGCAGRGFDVFDEPNPCTLLAVALDRDGERYGAA